MSYVEIKDVVKEYKTGEITIKAADGMNFSFEKGEFVVIVGPSGAGKTTVLNILGGMDKLTSGNVIVDGKDISRYSNRELTTYRRHDIGFVFQFYNLVQNLTALENVELAGQICKNPLDAKKVLESVGLKERMKTSRHSFQEESSKGYLLQGQLQKILNYYWQMNRQEH